MGLYCLMGLHSVVNVRRRFPIDMTSVPQGTDEVNTQFAYFLSIHIPKTGIFSYIKLCIGGVVVVCIV